MRLNAGLSLFGGGVMAARARAVVRPSKMRLGMAWLAACLFVLLPLRPIHAEDPALTAVPADRGFSYRNDQRSNPNWSIHVFKFDRSRRDLFLTSTTGGSGSIGMSLLTDQIKDLPAAWGTPLAAVNGDFYTTEDDYRGDPRDVQIRNGELISAPAGHAGFWIDAAGEPHAAVLNSGLRVRWPDGSTHPMGLNELRESETVVLYSPMIGATTRSSGGVDLILTNVPGQAWLPLQVGKALRARVAEIKPGGDSIVPRDGLVLSIGSRLPESVRKLPRGAELQLEFATQPDLTGVETALGGGPTLVRGGKAMTWSSFQVRHPRSAMGWDKTHLYLVEVDGRQPDLSVGMTFPELAAYMLELGCQEAINLDGGGSAAMWVLGQIVNSPSEGQPRPGANALVVLRRPSAEARKP